MCCYLSSYKLFKTMGVPGQMTATLGMMIVCLPVRPSTSAVKSSILLLRNFAPSLFPSPEVAQDWCLSRIIRRLRLPTLVPYRLFTRPSTLYSRCSNDITTTKTQKCALAGEYAASGTMNWRSAAESSIRTSILLMSSQSTRNTDAQDVMAANAAPATRTAATMAIDSN